MDKTEQEALRRVNEVRAERGWPEIEELEAEKAARAEDAAKHEAFRREVSDRLIRRGYGPDDKDFGHFILPDPVVDPLDEIMRKAGVCSGVREEVLAEIAKRGLQITEVKSDD